MELECNSQVAPVFRLPAETFRHIFGYFAAIDKDIWERCIQVSLTQVCRLWRTIALDMPILWNYILVRLPRDEPLDRVAAYFARSQPSRITLNIFDDWEQATFTPQGPILQQLLRLIRNYHSQLECVTLVLHGDIQEFIRALSHCQFTSMTSLSLDLNCPRYSRFATDELALLFQRGSNISRLSYKGLFVKPSPHLAATLTHLQVIGPQKLPTELIYDVLRQYPELISLDVDRIVPGVPTALPATVVTVPKLEKLKATWNQVDPGLLFSRLEAPSLHTLDIRQSLKSSAERHHTLLDDFLTRSRCNLRSLIFGDAFISSEGLAHYLRLPGLQSLTSLRLLRPTPSEEVLRCFSSRPGDGGLGGVLPHLESLHLAQKCAFPDGAFRDIFASRSAHSGYSALRYLGVDIPESHAADIAYLESLIAAGTSVQRFYSRER